MKSQQFKKDYPNLHKSLECLVADTGRFHTIREDIYPGPGYLLNAMEYVASKLTDDELTVMVSGEVYDRIKFINEFPGREGQFSYHQDLRHFDSWLYWVFEENWDNTFVLRKELD